MAPEQVRGLPCDERSDLYSAAVVLYEMLLGRHPLPQEASDLELRQAIVHRPPPALPAAVPRPLARVARRGLSKPPARRFGSAQRFLAALDAATAVPVAGATRSGTPGSSGRPAPRPRSPAAARRPSPRAP